MGVFKRLEEVPEEYRFEQYADAYEGRDVWAEYVASLPTEYDSAHFRASVRKAGDSWKSHMGERGRHHALATPLDVEAWCSELAESRTVNTVNKEYFVRVEGFYDWLQFHPDHPHVYQPALMAAANYETANAVWRAKFVRGGERRE